MNDEVVETAVCSCGDDAEYIGDLHEPKPIRKMYKCPSCGRVFDETEL